ncbi:MAG: hypothetical protein Q7J13_15135 [Brevundimonas sp.]|uniref:hypothetical protein n=1 Tax=Brevundimonas sp. TaxID=1871086 RepID=UPI00272460B5|nr:hypothetical protein [Brevundimonas sp.]MDO9589247.1 hypothetical protein [Brevundimonas sp.]
MLSEISPGCLRQAHAEIFNLPWLVVAGAGVSPQTSFCAELATIRSQFGSRLFPDIARELVLATVDARLLRTPVFTDQPGRPGFTLDARAERLRRRMRDAARGAINDFGALGLVALADGLPLDAYAPEGLAVGAWEGVWEDAKQQKEERAALHASATGNELAELLSLKVDSALLFDGTWKQGQGDWIRSLPETSVAKKDLKKGLNYLRSQIWALKPGTNGAFEIEPGPMFTAYAERPHIATDVDLVRSIAATVIRAAVAKLNWAIAATEETTRRCPEKTREMICDRLVKAAKVHGLRGLVLELTVPASFA